MPKRTRPEPSFDEAVERVVRAIPKGKTLSYAQVALYAGKPGAARAVVQAPQRAAKERPGGEAAGGRARGLKLLKPGVVSKRVDG